MVHRLVLILIALIAARATLDAHAGSTSMVGCAQLEIAVSSARCLAAIHVESSVEEWRWLIDGRTLHESTFSLPIVPVQPTSALGERPLDSADVPPPPSSFLISVASLVGLGVFASGRYAAGSIAALPDWYHDGGVQQVGYATPFPLDVTLWSPVACRFGSPIPPPPAAPISRIDSESLEKLRDSFRAPSQSPRSPPFTV